MKFIKILMLLACLVPQITLGATAVGWNAPTVTSGFILPNFVNGTNQEVRMPVGFVSQASSTVVGNFRATGNGIINGTVTGGSTASFASRVSATALGFRVTGNSARFDCNNGNQGSAICFFGSTNEELTINSLGAGIGDTTPTSQLQISTTTGTLPQLTLDNGVIGWSFKAGSTLYLATSTPSTSATSTAAAFSVDENGFPSFLALAASSGTNCLRVDTNGKLSNTGSACGSGGGGGGGDDSKFSTSTSTKFPNAIYVNGGPSTLVGIGTSTPAFQLQIASSTGPQLSLTDASLTSNQWYFRSVGSNLYMGTSSPSTFATSSVPAISIVAGAISGVVGIGTDNPRAVNANAHLTVAGTGSQDIIASTTDNTTLSDSVFNAYAPQSRIFMGAHGINQVSSRYGLTLGGWGEISAFDNNGSTNGMVIGTNTAVPIVFGTQNAERMRITDVGTVGIGTSTPKWALNIASSTGPQLALSDPSDATNDHWTMRSANENLYIATSSPTTFATATPTLTLTQNGNVGIGTATSLNKLTVNGAPEAVAARSLLNIGGTALGGGSANGNYIGINAPTGFAGNLVKLELNSANRFSVDSAGAGSFGSTLIAASRITATGLGFRTTGNSLRYDCNNGNIGNSFCFFGSSGEDMVMASAGMGIGTSTPRWPFQVASSTRSQIALSDASLTSNHWNMRNAGGILYIATSSPLTFSTSTQSALVLDTNGYLGIGTTSPTGPLSTNGKVFHDGLTTATNNDVCINATTKEITDSGGSTCLASSKYTKHNIHDLDIVATAMLKNMKFKDYVYNGTDDYRYGLIAEDLDANGDFEKGKNPLVEYAQSDITVKDEHGKDHVIKQGEPRSVDYQRGVLTVIGLSLQEQIKRIDAIDGTSVNKAAKSVQDQWQWVVIGILAIVVGKQQLDIKKLKK